MHQRALFLVAMLASQQLAAATNPVAIHPTKLSDDITRPTYFVTNGDYRLALNYLTRHQHAILQQVLHQYKDKGLALNKKSSSERNKLLLALLILLLLGGGAYYIHRQRQTATPQAQQPIAQARMEPLAQPIPAPIICPEPITLPTAQTIPTAQATPTTTTANTNTIHEALMAGFNQTMGSLNDLHHKFTNDPATSCIGSIASTAQQTTPFIDRLQGLMQPDSYGGQGYHSQSNTYDRYPQTDPFAAQFPQAPKTHFSNQAGHQTTAQAPIRVSIPASTDNLTTRLQALQK